MGSLMDSVTQMPPAKLSTCRRDLWQEADPSSAASACRLLQELPQNTFPTVRFPSFAAGFLLPFSLPLAGAASPAQSLADA